MICRLVKIDNLSGQEASVYSIYIEEHDKTVFDIFLEENFSSFKSEIINILDRLKTIGHDTGAREQFFKLKEGNLGDGVCALFDDPEKNLRLYCARFGKSLIILGGGGHKPKSIRALQEDEKLYKENYFLRDFIVNLKDKMKEKEIKINWDEDVGEFEGDLEFDLEY